MTAKTDLYNYQSQNPKLKRSSFHTTNAEQLNLCSGNMSGTSSRVSYRSLADGMINHPTLRAWLNGVTGLFPAGNISTMRYKKPTASLPGKWQRV